MYQHQKPAYSIPEAQALLAIGRAHLYKEIQRGRLQTIKNGRRTLITASGIDDYLELLEKETREVAA